jgi:hypothetical protein
MPTPAAAMLQRSNRRDVPGTEILTNSIAQFLTGGTIK